MRLTQYTDYGLRILLYLGLKRDLATARELSENFKMSRNHIAKIIHQLGQMGWVETSKGKGGGIRLATKALDLNLSVVIKRLEPDFHLVECFNQKENQCPIAGVCRLEGLLYSAREAFFQALEGVTIRQLAEHTKTDPRLKRLGLATK